MPGDSVRPHWVTGKTSKYSCELTYVTLCRHPNSSRYYDNTGKYALLVYIRLAFSLILCKIIMVFYYVYFSTFSSFSHLSLTFILIEFFCNWHLVIIYLKPLWDALNKLRKFNTIHIFLDSINTSFFPCSFSRF